MVEVSTGIAAPLCGRLLADAGATVVSLDLGQHDGVPPSASWRAYLDVGKERRTVVAAGPELAALLGGADLLLTSLPDGVAAALGVGCEQSLAAHPALIAACITPFGQSGPYAALAGDDVAVAALSGLSDCTPGFPDRRERMDDPPVQSRAPLTEVAGALVGATAIMGALLARLRGEPGPRHVELASLEATTTLIVNEWGPTAYGGGVRGRRPGHMDQEPNSYLAAADGWVNVTGMTPPYWEALLDMMGRPDWALAPEFATPESRAANYETLMPPLRAWVKTRPRLAFFEEAQARGLPICPVTDLRDTLASEHVRAVGSTVETGGRVLPADALLVNGVRRERPGGGEGTGAGAAVTPAAVSPLRTARPATSPRPLAAARGATAAPHQLPLQGTRVLDLTQFLAGPFAGQTLASLGADVVVVESSTRLVTRSFGPFGGVPTYDASMNFNFCARGKRSATLNLKTDEGRATLDQLVRSSDVVIENYSARFAAQLGLTYERLRMLREDIIVGSLSAFGRSGPWGRYIGLHSGVMALSGLAGVTRDEEGRPRFLGAALPDTLSGTYLACAVVQALAQRELTGEGCQLELSMLDVGLLCMGGLVPDAATDEPTLRHPVRFLRTSEPERFVAVAAQLPAAEWEAIEREVATLTRGEAMAALQARGLRAGSVQDVADVMVDPHLGARGFVAVDNHPVAGARPAPGVAWLYDGGRPQLPHAPLLGADTDDVLLGAGFDAASIAALRAGGALA